MFHKIDIQQVLSGFDRFGNKNIGENRMTNSCKCALCALAVLGAMAVTTDANAGRFQRGTMGVLTCLGEIPREVKYEHGNRSGLVGMTTGAFRGTFYAGKRLGYGVYDLATSPLDLIGK